MRQLEMLGWFRRRRKAKVDREWIASLDARHRLARIEHETSRIADHLETDAQAEAITQWLEKLEKTPKKRVRKPA